MDDLLPKELREELEEKYKEFKNEDRVVEYLSAIFKALGDPTRLKIIYLLSQHSLCVTDISEILNMNQSSISHQLSILRNLGLVRINKNGKFSEYYLDDHHVVTLFKQGYEHASHKKKGL